MYELQKIIADIVVELFQFIDIFHFLIPQMKGGAPIDVELPINITKLLLGTAFFLLAFSVISAIGLTTVAARFAVKSDPRIEKVRDLLPSANCGACGFGGCQGYAEAVVTKIDVAPSLCIPGKRSVAKAIEIITDKRSEIKEPAFSRIMCQGSWTKSSKSFKYEGMQDCRAAVLAGGGDKSCIYGCLGYGTCMRACPFDAITMSNDHLPVVDLEKCTGCRKCEITCPKNVIEVLPQPRAVFVACHSKDKGVDLRKKCQVGCIACRKCVRICPFDAPKIEDNISRIDISKCKVCGLCVSGCPTGAIVDLIPERSKAFVTDKCIGCGICTKVCPVNAATGESKKIHVIDRIKCIGCGICTAKCPVQAIGGTFNVVEVFAIAAAKKKKKAVA